MIKIDPLTTEIPKLHHTILGTITPRPIAFASTVDAEGNPNLSPFSFFNAFGVNPATLIFSPSRRGRDNTVKHTYENVKEIPEVVINVVTYDMVEQVSLSSTEYPKGVNEFLKSGFTQLPSEKVKPFRVKESPVQYECKVRQIIETGDKGGAGILIVCEVLLIHLDENILDEDGNVDPHKLDAVGRLGGDYYCRTSGNSVFKVEKPLQRMGIGIDNLPENIRNSNYLSGNDLGKLGNLESLPTKEEIDEIKQKPFVIHLLKNLQNDELPEKQIHLLAKTRINDGRIDEAIKLLMMEVSYR
jgi:flavin reductase (DIM6/NTAB) family NADH-FMN oxidoreductase RutF